MSRRRRKGRKRRRSSLVLLFRAATGLAREIDAFTKDKNYFLTIRFYIPKTIAADASIVNEEEEGEKETPLLLDAPLLSSSRAC